MLTMSARNIIKLLTFLEYLWFMEGKLLEHVLKIQGVDMRSCDKEIISLYRLHKTVAITVDEPVLIRTYWFHACYCDGSA